MARHEHSIETMDRSSDCRPADHSEECALCGDQMDLDRVIPDDRGASDSSPLLG